MFNLLRVSKGYSSYGHEWILFTVMNWFIVVGNKGSGMVYDDFEWLLIVVNRKTIVDNKSE